MADRNHHTRSASFDITSLHYYYSHCQPPPPLLDGDESQFTKKNCNNSTLRKSHSVQDLPSQLEFQIELKLTRRLKLMKEEGGANNNEEVVVGGGCAVESMECNETESDEEFIGEVENDDDESIGEDHVEDDFTEDELVRNLLRRQPVVEQPQQQQECTLQEESESNDEECTTNDYESSFMEWRRTTDCSEDTPRVGNVSSHLVVGVVDEGMECCNEIEVERVAAESDNVGNEASLSQDRIEEQSLSSQIATDDIIIMPPTINKKSARHGWIREMVGGGNAETKGDMEAGLNEQDEGKYGGIAGKIGSGGDMTFSTATSTITANSSRLGAQDVVATKSESDDDVGVTQSNQHQERIEEPPSPQPTTDDDMMQSPMEEKRNVRHDSSINQMVGNEEKQQQEKTGDERDEEDKKGNIKVRVTKEAISGSDDIPLLSATTNTTIFSRTSTATSTTSVATTSRSNSSKSSNNKSNNSKMDVLTEGQYFLSISMLVYMYSHLRETCRMGHTRVKMEEIDCNNSIILGGRSGLQQQQQCSSPVRMFSSLMESMHSMGSSSPLQQSQQSSYLSNNNNNNTVTAGSIIRVVIDELEDYDKEHTDDYYYQANSHHREYEESIMKEFRQWIEESVYIRQQSTLFGNPPNC
eukprot:scaffold17647_cov83-Skeletonema_dohrnii-CCMP3373.AAC.4